MRNIVVLFLPRPQNRGRKSLCNLRTLKLRRVDFTVHATATVFDLSFERKHICS